MSKLYITATPIGNLSDISLRAIETLKRVDFILCEDTRTTAKLLHRFKVNTPTISYHQHSKLKKVERIVDLLKQGRDVALVSDAGTPGIADPGGKLVEQVVRELGSQVEVVAVPGPCALTAAASVSGLPMDRFVFMGFPPAKKKRRKFFQEVLASKYPVILYESPHRILKTLTELGALAERGGSDPPQIGEGQTLPGLQVVLCRELTKLHETTYRGTPQDIAKKLKTDKIKGEFIIILKPYDRK